MRQSFPFRVRGIASTWRPPQLSVVLVVYDMPEQAYNTIRSLSPGHQRGVAAGQYEIVVVENGSESLLDPATVRSIAANARYVLREERGTSPAAAVNDGILRARGRWVAVMVDGARMVTPGVVQGILLGQRLGRGTLVSVPGYHLGDQLHQDAARSGYSADEEQQMLAAMGWLEDGYRLFQRAVLSASCRDGYLRPLGESNCIALSRRDFRRVGRFDEAFVTLGGGFVNLDFYRRAVDACRRLVVLPGEGTFHQFHGGATTGAPAVDRDALLDDMRAEYQRIRGQVHAPPQRKPLLLGEVSQLALPFLAHSVARAEG